MNCVELTLVILLYLQFVFRSTLACTTNSCAAGSANVTPHHTAGLILARGGSKGIFKKNLALVGGVSLLQRTLDTMHSYGGFDSMWVSTDDEEIAVLAKKVGAEVHWRAPETATDHASSLFAAQEFISKHSEITVLALIQCTSPFLQSKFLASAHKMIQDGHDSVFSVTRQFKLQWKEMGGEYVAVNFNPAQRPRRQDWQVELVENGAFYFTDVRLIQEGRLQGLRVGVVEIPSHLSLEIDSPNDLAVANCLAEALEGEKDCLE